MQHVCVACDHVMAEPLPVCPSCNEERSLHWRLPATARFGVFEIKTTCRHCGHPLILDGPRRRTHCTSCHKDVEFAPELWASLFDDLHDDFHKFAWGSSCEATIMNGAGTFEVVYGKQMPACPACNKTIPYVEPGTDARLACERCQHAIEVFPAPPWLRAVAPTAVQLYAAERELDGTTSAPAVIASDDIKPIVMACPNCAAALRLDASSPRITPCGHCQTDVYLPDALWLKLHPVRTVQRFAVRFESPAYAEAPPPAVIEAAEPTPVVSDPGRRRRLPWWAEVMIFLALVTLAVVTIVRKLGG